MIEFDAEAVRRQTQQQLVDLGAWVPETFPVLDSPVSIRAQEESLDRLLALFVAVVVSYGFPRDRATAWLDREGLAQRLTAMEADFIEGKTASDQQVQFGLQFDVEGMWVLAWALDLGPQLDFRRPCEDTFVQLFPDLKQNQDSTALRAKARMRPAIEVVSALDLAYCLHWFTWEAHVGSVARPDVIEDGAIRARRRALEWLASEDDWDRITLDT